MDIVCIHLSFHLCLFFRVDNNCHCCIKEQNYVLTDSCYIFTKLLPRKMIPAVPSALYETAYLTTDW